LLVDRSATSDWFLSPIGFGITKNHLRACNVEAIHIPPVFMSEQIGKHGFASADPLVQSSDPDVENKEVPLIVDGPIALMDTIVHFWANHATTCQIAEVSKSPLELRTLMSKTVATMWTPLIEYIAELCSLLDYRGEEFEENIRNVNRAPNSDALLHIRETLARVNRCRRLLRWSMGHLRVNLAVCGQTDGQLNASAKQFVPILEKLQFETSKVESLMPVVLGCSNLLEVHQNAKETRFISRLTLIAALFIPLSALTSFFGMDARFLPRGEEYARIWEISVPITVGLLLFTYFAELRTAWMRWVMPMMGGRSMA